MTWNEYYSEFYDWSKSTQISKISQLSFFGNSPDVHLEVVDAAQSFSDEKIASRLIKKAIASGVKFTVEEIIELQMFVTKDCMNELVRSCPYRFSQEQVDEIIYSIDDNLYKELEKKYCKDGDESNENRTKNKHRKPSRLFAILGLSSESVKDRKFSHYKIGDHVRVKYRGQEGTIIDINDGLYMVSLADGKTVDSYLESDLEKAW